MNSILKCLLMKNNIKEILNYLKIRNIWLKLLYRKIIIKNFFNT